MFSKLKNFFDNQPPFPSEIPPNPLYAMLTADTAAMSAGKKTSKIRAVWTKHFDTYSVAAHLPYFYDFLLENIDAALTGRLKDGTGLYKFAEALASDKFFHTVDRCRSKSEQEADQTIASYAPAICARIDAVLEREWPAEMQTGAWLAEVFCLFFYHAAANNHATRIAAAPWVVPFLRRWPEQGDGLILSALDDWGDASALSEYLMIEAQNARQQSRPAGGLWNDMMGVYADKRSNVYRQAEQLLTALTTDGKISLDKREALLCAALDTLNLVPEKTDSRKEAHICIRQDSVTRHCLTLLADNLPGSPAAETIRTLLSEAESAPKAVGTYNLNQIPSVPFADIGLKIAVIDELMYRRDLLKPRLLLDTFVKEYEGRRIDREADGYAVIPEILEYFERLDIPQHLLNEVGELYIDGGLDGGSALYEEMFPFFDPGCGDELLPIGKQAVADLAYLPNLRRIIGLENCNPPPELIHALQEAGVEIIGQE
ncbi:DUF6892 domain-containing protein [Neisseria elongata]|jgi:hypothetical protein|uniref:DUF6892 domain-containing protein n=1 Tax=Neisseria elongata TaxID=495 RepID=UPI000E0E0927|nr:hypothetical protein [Neisseria elongata]